MTSPWSAPDPSTRETSTPPPGQPVLTAPRAIAIVAGAVLLVAGLVGLLALANGDEERPESAVATTALPEPTAEPTTAPEPPATEAGGPVTDGGAPATTAGPATTARTGTSPATAGPSVPPATGAAATSAPAVPAPATPAPAMPGAPTPAPAPPPSTAAQAQQAVALAQRLGDALAAGQWDAARALNPGRNESDAFLEQAYGPLVRTTIVPATVVDTGGGRFDLRIGLVAHEDQPTGRQSVLMCAHWTVDVPGSTVTRLAFNRLRVEPGFVDPAARAAELRTTCAAAG